MATARTGQITMRGSVRHTNKNTRADSSQTNAGNEFDKDKELGKDENVGPETGISIEEQDEDHDRISDQNIGHMDVDD
jgi:hypothetical protein